MCVYIWQPWLRLRRRGLEYQELDGPGDSCSMTRRASPDDEIQRPSVRPFHVPHNEISCVLILFDGASSFVQSIRTRFHQHRLLVSSLKQYVTMRHTSCVATSGFCWNCSRRSPPMRGRPSGAPVKPSGATDASREANGSGGQVLVS